MCWLSNRATDASWRARAAVVASTLKRLEVHLRLKDVAVTGGLDRKSVV